MHLIYWAGDVAPVAEKGFGPKACEALGLNRVAREVPPLSSYIAEIEAAKAGGCPRRAAIEHPILSRVSQRLHKGQGSLSYSADTGLFRRSTRC